MTLTSDKKAYLAALEAFKDAAQQLSTAWEALNDGAYGNRCYPDHMPSFDEFVLEVMEWHSDVEQMQREEK